MFISSAMPTYARAMRQRIVILAITALLFSSGCAALVGGGAALREDVAALEQGMTKQAVQDELGKPWDINVTSTQYGKRTQWVYKEASLSRGQLYVYFEDGRLTTTQY